MRARRGSAFTIVEMLIGIAIVGLLAALAVPAYYTMIRRAHRAEGVGLLRGLSTLETAYFAETRRYGCLTDIGFQIEGDSHFAVWVCDDPSGCLCPETGTACTETCCVCPCVDAPDDWSAPGQNPTTALPSGTPAPVPASLPATCANLVASPVLTGTTSNWCRRAIPEVVEILWFTTETGNEIYHDPFIDDPATLDDCF